MAPHARRNLLKASYILTRKIVKGRYVRMSTWTFSQWPKKPSVENTGALALCCHLPSALVSCTEDGLVTPRRHDSQLVNALCRVFSCEHFSLGHYFFCAVEFQVKLDRRGKRLTIEAWQDLGPEGSVYHANWRTAAWDSRQHSIVEHMVQNRLLGSERSPFQELYEESGPSTSDDEDGGEQNWSAGSDSWANRYISHSRLYHPLQKAE